MTACNSCYQLVMFKADGTCPACGQNQGAYSKNIADKALVKISIGQKIPSACISCGTSTDKFQSFLFTYDVVESKTLISRFMSYVPGNTRRKSQKVSLPICNTCLPNHKDLKPHSLRFELDYTLLVHRNFQKQFEALNGPPEIELT